MPPTRTQPVTKTFLSRALNRTGLAWARDPDGDCYARLSGETPEEFLHCWFLLEEGQTCKIFELRCLVQPVIPWQNLPAALIAANRYNETYRFGKLYVTPADDHEAGVTLRFEGQIDVTYPVSEGFLANYVASHLANICDFLSEAFKDQELLGHRPPTRSRRRVPARKRHGNGGRSRKEGGEA